MGENKGQSPENTIFFKQEMAAMHTDTANYKQCDVQGSKMSANADLALQATCPDLDVQGPKMSAKADEISRDQKQLSDIFA